MNFVMETRYTHLVVPGTQGFGQEDHSNTRVSGQLEDNRETPHEKRGVGG